MLRVGFVNSTEKLESMRRYGLVDYDTALPQLRLWVHFSILGWLNKDLVDQQAWLR
jgi:hypothetical protein